VIKVWEGEDLLVGPRLRYFVSRGFNLYGGYAVYDPETRKAVRETLTSKLLPTWGERSNLSPDEVRVCLSGKSTEWKEIPREEAFAVKEVSLATGDWHLWTARGPRRCPVSWVAGWIPMGGMEDDR
jgi:hypothetical protein